MLRTPRETTQYPGRQSENSIIQAKQDVSVFSHQTLNPSILARK